MATGKPGQFGDSARKSRGKYITLVVLVFWALAVFVFTLLKFAGGQQ